MAGQVIRWRRLWTAPLTVALALAAGVPLLAAAPPVPAKPPWEGRLHSCTLPDVTSVAKCGSFKVFENRAAGSGRQIPLRVVVMPAASSHPEPDPIFILNGGPGESATYSAPDFVKDPLRRRRDVVLIDTRGTGGSNPLACSIWGDGTRLDRIFPPDTVLACRDELAKKADLTQYTTAAAMDDVDDVRRWLGYGRVNLIGASYGTYAAQVFVARHPDAVRSIVLASVAKPGEPAPLYHGRNAQHSLELLARDCDHDAKCHAAFPRFLAEVAEVLDRLAKQPVQVAIQLDPKQKPVTVTLTRSAAAEAMRFSLYSAKAGNLPLRVHLAAGGDYRDLARAAVLLRQALQENLAFGLMFSVTCAEDVSRIDPNEIAAATAGTFYGDDRVRDQLAVCAVWPHAPLAAGSGALPRSDVPALLVAGERDPVTPAADAAEVARNFVHGRLIVIPGGAHAAGAPCEQRLIEQFIARGSAEGLDASCAQKAAPFHFATH